MFNLEKAHFIIDEMILNGCPYENNESNILQSIRDLDKST